MKTIAAIAALCLGICGQARAQGLVNFINSATTLISYQGGAIPATPGTFYFALLTAPVGTTDPTAFTFSGRYATNQTVAGRINGGFSVPVTGWQPGETRAFEVVGWSADGGATFNPSWLTGYPLIAYFGISAIGPAGVAGGFDGTSSLPLLSIFGGAQGIPSGFSMVWIPEPSSSWLTLFGMVTWRVWRNRRQPNSAS